jgi:hypothetical protein
MLKKIFLSSLCLLSTIAIAQIKLDLDATIIQDLSESHVANTVLLDENIPVTIEYDSLTIVLSATKINAVTIIVETELLKKTEAGELISISKPVLKIDENKEASLKIGDSNGNSLTLIMTLQFTE